MGGEGLGEVATPACLVYDHTSSWTKYLEPMAVQARYKTESQCPTPPPRTLRSWMLRRNSLPLTSQIGGICFSYFPIGLPGAR